MSRRCCCCVYAKDSFYDRTIDPLWSNSSSWSQAGGRLRATGSGQTSIYQLEQPSDVVAYTIACKIYFAKAGDEALVIFDYLDDNNYGYCKITVVDSDHIALELYRRSNGSDELIAAQENLSFTTGAT